MMDIYVYILAILSIVFLLSAYGISIGWFPFVDLSTDVAAVKAVVDLLDIRQQSIGDNVFFHWQREYIAEQGIANITVTCPDIAGGAIVENIPFPADAVAFASSGTLIVDCDFGAVIAGHANTITEIYITYLSGGARRLTKCFAEYDAGAGTWMQDGIDVTGTTLPQIIHFEINVTNDETGGMLGRVDMVARMNGAGPDAVQDIQVYYSWHLYNATP